MTYTFVWNPDTWWCSWYSWSDEPGKPEITAENIVSVYESIEFNTYFNVTKDQLRLE